MNYIKNKKIVVVMILNKNLFDRLKAKISKRQIKITVRFRRLSVVDETKLC